MELADFTFVNTTGGSTLSGPAAKRMRAHITRTNFAKRREQLTGPRAVDTTKRRRQNISKDNTAEVNLPLAVQLNPRANIAAFHKIQELVFLEGRHTANSPSEAAWFNLIASEPALVEASLAIAVRQWSPDNTWQLKADQHSCIAVMMIKEQITSAATRTDGILGAVVTMAFGAALAHDGLAWKIHIDGLVQIIRDRLARDPKALPSWFVDLIVHDLVNGALDFPRVWHRSIVEALGEYHDQRIQKLADLCDRFRELRKVIESQHTHPFSAISIAEKIEEPLAILHYEARGLRSTENLYIDAASRALELVMYVLWPTQSGAHLTYLAGGLRNTITRFPIKGCSYMDLSSFQLMIGAVAADKGSAARAWFVDRISRAVRWMQARGWQEPLELLEKRFAVEGNAGLVGRFRALWRELSGIEATIDVQDSMSRRKTADLSVGAFKQ
ncbi:hypothetical protein BJX70DRAFT_361777 [Aspergillus crustosus]